MAKTKALKDKTFQEKLVEREERQRRLLERLGLVQLVFDFYTAPVA